jgi:hypothetical protein
VARAVKLDVLGAGKKRAHDDSDNGILRGVN